MIDNIALFCATEKLHMMLEEDGAIKALLGMVRSGNSDVIAQVARGLANFAKCESRGIIQGLFLLLFYKAYDLLLVTFTYDNSNELSLL